MTTVTEVQDASADVYADTLDSVTNDDTYDGEITGLFDGRTAQLLETWVDDGLKCPVVFEGRRGTNKETVAGQNFHTGTYGAYDGGTDRVYVMDLTDAYPLPDEDRRVLEGDTEHGRYVVGDHQSYMRWSGPRSKPYLHVWPEGELVPWQFLHDFDEDDDLDEEVTRSGREVTRQYEFTRWTDGEGYLWSSRESRLGDTQLDSGLAFDVLEERED